MNLLVLLLLPCGALAHRHNVFLNTRRGEEGSEGCCDGEAKEASDPLEAIYVPPYTEWLSNIDSALAILKSHLIHQDELLHPNNPYVQYVMLLYAVNSLIGASQNLNYHSIYYDSVNYSVLETVRNPQKAADKVRAQLDKTNSKISVIRDLISRKQQSECTDPISYTCDLIIDIDVATLNDEVVKAQAHFLITLGKEANLFLDHYASVFEQKANNRGAQAYLVNGLLELEPLVMAGVDARREGQNILPLLSSRRQIVSEEFHL